MEDVKFDQLGAAIAAPTLSVSGTKLTIASMPTPFVPPVFESADELALTSSEVILIRASAAVGKSTLARALSATWGVPILDLAKVPVATGSLVGILSDYRGEASAIAEFHAGNAPILVDALDEGRLQSGDNGLLSFIETSADLILEDRLHRKPKLVLLGRAEAIGLAHLYLVDKGVDVATLDVGFFDEDGARRLVHAYALNAAKSDSLYLIHQKPAELLVTTYFEKIAAALGLSTDELWDHPAGRSFAGYAPVLAAIGSLLPEIENFAEAQNRLEDVGTDSAWSVIEAVLGSIVLRDQGKVVKQLIEAGVKGDTRELFSAKEQAALLLQYVQRQPLAGTGSVRLAPADMAKYADQVQRFLPEHPFLKEGKFSNDVIASYVIAMAVMNGWTIQNDQILRQLARQPFMWRSLKSSFTADTILEGEYLGYILSSFWSDPLTEDETVIVKDIAGDNGSFVEIVVRGDAVSFTATTPLHFYGQMRNVTVETTQPLSLIGVGDGPTRVFSFSGSNHITGTVLDLRATELRLRQGRTWLDAEVLPVTGQFSLIIQDGVDYGWSERLASTYPFSTYPSLITPDNAEAQDDLVEILSDLAARLATASSITLFADYSVAEGDYMRSLFNAYGDKFVALISTLVSEKLATTTAIQAAGPPKVRVRLRTPVAELCHAAKFGGADDQLNASIEVLRQRVRAV